MGSMRTEDDDVAIAETFVQYIRNEKIDLTVEVLNKFQPEAGMKEDWNEFLKEQWDYKLNILKKAGSDLQFHNLPVVKLKDLTKKYVGELIELEECRIASISPNRMAKVKTSFYCDSCGVTFSVENVPKKLKCKECKSSDLTELEAQKEDIIDTQWVRLQETNRDTSQTKIPLAVPTLLKGEDMMWKVGFNESVKPKGLMRVRPIRTKMGDHELIQWFEIFALEKTCAFDEDITYDDTFREYIKLEMKKPYYWNKLVRSFCPWIVGQDVMKEAVLLGLGSMRTDMPLRILIIGDPSTGKSDVLKAANMLPAQKHYTVMKNNRGTGLTVTSVRDPDTDQWTVEPGEFARAHRWTVIIDEFQAGREIDVDGLNSVIWDHKIPYNLAGGVHGEFDASCVLIFACNPQPGRMAKEENIFVLLKFIGEKTLPAFISRMSFILYLEENNEREYQKKVAESIYRNWSDEAKKKRFWEDWYPEGEEPELELRTSVMEILDLPPVKTYSDRQHRFGIKTLQKILKYVTEEVILVDPPAELEKKFVEYYVDKRSDISERSNKIITPRYMVHLLGIAQNHGRWHGRGIQNEEDMEYAFQLMYKHMTLAATDFKTGEIDAGMTNGNIPESRMKEIDIDKMKRSGRGKQIDWACKKAGAIHSDGYFTLTELKEFLELLGTDNKWNDFELVKWLNDSQTYGSLKKDGEKYKWTPLEGRL